MDEGSTKCEENARYSFLLGSALRNEDTEQFLQIYDAIIPTEISPEQVDVIKEAARKIADLGEEDFNGLVSRALHFSVAAPAVPSIMTTSLSDEKNQYIMEDEVISRSGLRQVKRSPGPCTTWKTSGAGHDGVNEGETVEEHDDHGDSGVFSSSKNTSMSDEADIEELERRGALYFPPDSKPQLTKHKLRNVELQRKNNAAYDAVESVVDSDVEEHSPSLDDELSEVVTIKYEEIEMKPVRTEVKTYRSQDANCENFYLRQQNDILRKRNDLQYDEAVTVPDDDDPVVQHYTTSAHEHLLGRKYSQFTSMRHEEEEDYNAEVPEPPVVHARYRGNPMHGIPVRYTGANARTTMSGIKSDGVSIQRDVRQRGGSMRPQPPFGDPVNLDKVCASSSSLMESRQSLDVCNMPRGERLGHISSLNRSQDRDSEGNNNTDNSSKKKKKKKKNAKDDGGGDIKDVNGNPVPVEQDFRNSSKHSSFPRRTEDLNHYELDGRQISEMDEPTSASEQYKKKTRVTRRKENERATSIKAENIKGYQGEKSVEELLGFIENISNSSSSGNSGNKKKKKVGGNQLLNGNAEGNLSNGPLLADGGVTKTIKKLKPGNKIKASSLPKDLERSSDAMPENAEQSSEKVDETKEAEYPIAESTKKPVPAPHQLRNNDPAKTVNSKGKPENFDMKDIEDNAMFIFTDFENVVPMPEEEFKVVTRKKTTRTLPITPQASTSAPTKDCSKDSHHNYDHAYNSGYVAHGIQNPSDSNTSDFLRARDDRVIREERSSSRKSRPIVRSITPPPTSSSHSSDEYYAEKPPVERAFSPSAFPALGGMREGRRNSTGNVPSESTPDDSDIESVKSLPLVAASKASTSKVEGAISPIVSYAKIAAGPKTAGKGAVVTSSTSVSVAGKEEKNSEPDSEAVEITRRHSSSSLIDATVKEDSKPEPDFVAHPVPSKDTTKPVTVEVAFKPKSPSVEKVIKTPEGVAQPEEPKDKVVNTKTEPRVMKNIKQDVPAISTVANKEGSIRNAKVEAITTHTKRPTSGYSPQMPYCDNKLHQKITFGSSAILDINEPVKPTVNTDNPPVLNMKEFPSISELHGGASSLPPATVAAGSLSFIAQVDKPLPPVAIIPPCPPTQCQSNPQSQPSSATTAAATITNPTPNNTNKTPLVSNNKKQKNKSVVFLDNKRSHSSPQSLGISFGFDSNLNFMASVSDASEVASVAVAEPKGNADFKPGTRGLNGIVQVLYDMVQMKDEKKSTQNNAVAESPATSSATDSLTVIEDPTAMQALMNSNKVSKPSGIPQITPSAPGAISKSVTEAPLASEPVSGASAPVQSDNDKRLINLQNLVPPNHALDPNYARGRFSVEDAVIHMKREWDQIMDMKNKDPAKVIFYSSH